MRSKRNNKVKKDFFVSDSLWNKDKQGEVIFTENLLENAKKDYKLIFFVQIRGSEKNINQNMWKFCIHKRGLRRKRTNVLKNNNFLLVSILPTTCEQHFS